jgi:UDP-N-acetylglucosamine transferase subunit ALG13
MFCCLAVQPDATRPCRLHEYVPNMTTVIEKSSLIISHCGAGSAFEALCLRVPLIVVPNPALMDNHQVELATLLEDQGYLVCSPPIWIFQSATSLVVLGARCSCLQRCSQRRQ